MSLTTSLAIYFLIWWLTLFAVLPFGVRSQHEGGSFPPGTDPGAPTIPRLGWKLLWTTAVSAVIFAGLYVVHTRRLVSFDDLLWLFGMPR